MKKKIFCPNCNGHGFIAKCDENKAWSERCTECNGIGEIEVPMTHWDVFLSMSDEAVAGWLSKLVCHDCTTTFHCHECHPDDESCAEEILKWLKKEAKDGCL